MNIRVLLATGCLLISAEAASADARLVIQGSSLIFHVLCDAEQELAVLAPIPHRNDIGPARAVALIVVTPNAEPEIVTGVSEIYEGTLSARIPITTNSNLFRSLSSDEPVQVARANLAYVIPSQLAGVGVARVGQGCRKQSEAEQTTAIPSGSFWSHDGSVVTLEASKLERKFVFNKPSAAMRALDVQPGTVRFEGELSKGTYVGKAFLFSKKCGRSSFPAIGKIENHDERVVLTGVAPKRNESCKTIGTQDVVLTFDFLKQPGH